MNTRTLGTLCILGGLVGMAEALRQVSLGTPLGPGLRELDAITNTAEIVAAVGGLCGLLGFIALRGTGTKPLFRLLAYLPAISFAATIVMGVTHLSGMLASDADNPIVVFMVFLVDLFQPAAWLVVAILTVAAKEWQGWRRFVPFALVAAFPLGILVSTGSGLVGPFLIVHFAGTILLGYAVRSLAVAEESRVPVQPAYR